MIACYCRVSSQGPKERQPARAEIQRWLKGNGIKLSAVHWFEDKETGTTVRRPTFDDLQRAIFAGKLKTIVVWKLDRISRRQWDGINLLAEWCDRGVRVVSVTPQIDLNGAVGRMVASVMFSLAEIEMEYCRERQAARIAVAKIRGVYKGRRAGTTKADPARARQLRDRGLTVLEIATAMGIGDRTAFRYLAEAST